MLETKSRSLAKAVSYRVFGSISTAAIAFWFIGDIKSALSVGGLDRGVKIVLYFIHERMWDHVPFGRQQPPDYEI